MTPHKRDKILKLLDIKTKDEKYILVLTLAVVALCFGFVVGTTL
jgi:hypothetical protein